MMSVVYFDLRNPVDIVVRQIWLTGTIGFEEVNLYRRCIEKGLRGDFRDG